MRQLLRQLFLRAIADIDIRLWMQCVAVRRGEPLLVIAFGKAARPMASMIAAACPGPRLRGLVVPLEPDDAPLPPFEVIPGGHPLPTDGSLRAGLRALELCRSAGPEERVLFLVSGGGSAMLEVPADPGVTLAELREFYRALVASGADITSINDVRTTFSAVKGGRLALAASGANWIEFVLLSDAPHPASVASALPSNHTAARSVLTRFGLWPSVPLALRERLERDDLPPPATGQEPIWRRTQITVMCSNEHGRQALKQRARAAGLFVVEDLSVDDWPFERAAAHLLRHLDHLRRRHPGRPVAILSGGELSVPLPANPGKGGRNQQFALACARAIRGRPITVLSAGTDGIDGNSVAAGACVDGTTVSRAKQLGFSVHDHLRVFDAFPLLHALGDTVITGPTGTNVRDLRLLVHSG